MTVPKYPWVFRVPGFLVVLSLLLVLSACGESKDTLGAGTIRVSMLVQAGADDARWFQGVEVPKGTDTYELTEKVTKGDMKATYYPEYKSHFVDAIFGVENEGPNFWLTYVWNKPESKWEPLPVSADLYSLEDDHILAWYYTDTSQKGDSPTVTP